MYQVNQTERRREHRRELPEGSANVLRPAVRLKGSGSSEAAFCASYEYDTSFERASFEEVCG